ncbi:hypothetical protein ACVIJ6_006650 [Bradyrhizobium sp. USDA 4369]
MTLRLDPSRARDRILFEATAALLLLVYTPWLSSLAGDEMQVGDDPEAEDSEMQIDEDH